MNTKQVFATLHARGWATYDSQDGDMLGFAQKLGRVMPQRGRLVYPLIARETRHAAANTMSAQYGRASFPAHTDFANWPTPPRLVLLQAVAAGDVPTTLIDGRRLHESEAQRRTWSSTVWSVRGASGSFGCSMYFRADDRYALRWDPCCMLGRSADARRVNREVRARIQSAEAMQFNWRSSKEILVIDNWRILHARPPVEGTAVRVLLRSLVATSDYV